MSENCKICLFQNPRKNSKTPYEKQFSYENCMIVYNKSLCKTFFTVLHKNSRREKAKVPGNFFLKFQLQTHFFAQLGIFRKKVACKRFLFLSKT